MDKTIADYIEINRGLIQNYFVMKNKQGFLCLYISASSPIDLKGDELISDLAKKQIELNVITPLEYKKVAEVVGVSV